MAHDWQQLPGRSAARLFNGDRVLLAVPIGLVSGRPNPDFPYELHFARWDDDEVCERRTRLMTTPAASCGSMLQRRRSRLR